MRTGRHSADAERAVHGLVNLSAQRRTFVNDHTTHNWWMIYLSETGDMLRWSMVVYDEVLINW